MAAAKLNITIEQGTDFSQKLTIKDSVLALVDITAWSFAGQVRASFNATAILATFTFQTLDQTTNRGEVLMKLAHAVTSAIPAGKKKLTTYAYDVESTVAGIIDRVVEGDAILDAEVTK